MKTTRGAMMDERAAKSYGRRLLKSRWFLPSLQGIGLFLLIAGIFLGFFGVQETENSWTRWIFWDLWWSGGMVLILFTTGKGWCGICPLRAVTRIAERFSFGLALPKQFQNIAVSVIMYIVVVRLLLYLPGVALPRSPWNTAVYFLAFVILAVFTGVSFKRGSFCRYLCPLSAATDMYAFAAPVELRPDRKICKNCRTRDCVKGNNFADGCRYGIFPGNMRSDRHCTFCLDCVKSCPNDSMYFRKRPIFSGIWKEIRPEWGESFLSVTIFTLIFFRMGVGRHPVWTDLTSLIGVLPETTYFSHAKYIIRFLVSLVSVIVLFSTTCKLSAFITGEETNRHFSIFGYGYLPFCIVVGLLQYGWFDLGRFRLTLPVLLGTVLSLWTIIQIGRHRLKGNRSRSAITIHMILMTVLSSTILVFQNLWPMRLS